MLGRDANEEPVSHPRHPATTTAEPRRLHRRAHDRRRMGDESCARPGRRRPIGPQDRGARARAHVGVGAERPSMERGNSREFRRSGLEVAPADAREPGAFGLGARQQ